jgi:hypothetical protein
MSGDPLPLLSSLLSPSLPPQGVMLYPVGHVDVYGRQRASRHVRKLNTFAHAVGWRSQLGLASGVDMRIKYFYISV